ncbi:MAG: leucyl/phenylalanyl-tRNA--protein transferase [Acidobacteriota bacterium]
MTTSRFPDPRKTKGDVVAFGDDLRPETLIDAYRHGIFPWPMEGIPLPWFCPRRRAIIELKDVHISRSLRHVRARSGFRFTIDGDFRSVIEACATAQRPDQDGTWIFPQVVEAYCLLHAQGVAHSVEVWDQNELVGGVYGVDAGGAFNGESMFRLRPNASKLALLFLFEHLQSRGLDWFDVQVMSEHMRALGSVEITRAKFLDRLARTQKRSLVLFDPANPDHAAPSP